MAEVGFNKDDEYKVKIVDGGEYKEPGGGIRKPTQEEIDYYKIHRIIVMIIFAIVVAILLLVIVIMIATIDRCEPVQEKKELPWWKSGVIYNIYPRSFKDSAGDDGVGDFDGIIDKLDYLKKLGIKIIYLSSVFKVDTNVDYGYSVLDFKDTNTEYGSLSKFKKLIDNAHDKGFKVIIEFIPNDSSTQHKWFNESLNVSGAKKDWYIWQDSNVNVTNVTGSDSCWAKEKNTGKHYLYYCKYGPGKADLNWNNGDVQKELESVLGFWLDKGVDGFRVVSVARLFDVVKPPPSGPSNDVQKIRMILNKWHNYTTSKNADSILIGASHGASTAYYGSKELPELDIVVNFKLVPKDNADMKKFYSAANFKKLIDEYVRSIPAGKWPSWALTSWVHKRVASNVSPQLAKSLNVLLLTLPGTPIVFYGDEIGMKDVDNSNKSPMQWNKQKNGGFSNQSTWFGNVGNSSVVNAEDDQYGIKTIFKETVKFRAENQLALLNGLTTSTREVNVLVYTFQSSSDPHFVIVINFSSSTKTVDLSALSGGKKAEVKLSTSGKKGKVHVEMNKIEITAEDALVIKVDK